MDYDDHYDFEEPERFLDEREWESFFDPDDTASFKMGLSSEFYQGTAQRKENDDDEDNA